MQCARRLGGPLRRSCVRPRPTDIAGAAGRFLPIWATARSRPRSKSAGKWAHLAGLLWPGPESPIYHLPAHSSPESAVHTSQDRRCARRDARRALCAHALDSRRTPCAARHQAALRARNRARPRRAPPARGRPQPRPRGNRHGREDRRRCLARCGSTPALPGSSTAAHRCRCRTRTASRFRRACVRGCGAIRSHVDHKLQYRPARAAAPLPTAGRRALRFHSRRWPYRSQATAPRSSGAMH